MRLPYVYIVIGTPEPANSNNQWMYSHTGHVGFAPNVYLPYLWNIGFAGLRLQQYGV